MRMPGRRVLVQCPMRPMHVVCLDRRLDDPDPGCRKHGAEPVGELGVPVPDQELQPAGGRAQEFGTAQDVGSSDSRGADSATYCVWSSADRARDIEGTWIFSLPSPCSPAPKASQY
jgi:hypothetical protein